ncbi:S26A3 protein, partial [Atractosteus spatula]|nr:S26A3 protein [Atractosteus spatula]
MKLSTNQFFVNRPLYSEDTFRTDNEKVQRQHKTLLDHVKAYFRQDLCSKKRAKNAALSLLPIIGWVRMYRVKEWLLSDLVSGLSTGLVAVLQAKANLYFSFNKYLFSNFCLGLAFALLAYVPPGYGLYSAFFPVLTYFFLGTSRHISVGEFNVFNQMSLPPQKYNFMWKISVKIVLHIYFKAICPFPVLSMMVQSVVTRLVPDIGSPANITAFEGLSQDEQRVIVASSVSFLVGIFQLALGVLQVGFIVIYMSDTLISGFTTAAAVHILVSQLKFILGLQVPGKSGVFALVYTLKDIFSVIGETNIADLVTAIIIIVAVFVVKEVNDRYKEKLPVPIPIEVIMTVLACGLSYAFDFQTLYNVDIVGNITKGYESPLAPNFEVIQLSVMDAFSMAIVGFAVAFSVAKVYSVKHDYIIDGNQELIAFGVSNIFTSSFRGFASSTALSRSAVQESTGGKTQLAGLLSALVVMIVTVAIGFLLEPLQKSYLNSTLNVLISLTLNLLQSVLGALVVVNLKGMLMQVTEIPYLWKKDRPDCVVWVVTFLAAVFLGLDLGLAVGLGIELLTVIFRTQFPRCTVLANIKGTDIYRDRKDYMSIYEPEGIKIFRIPSPIFFANVDFFREKLNSAVGFNPLRVLRKRNKALRKIKKLLSKGELQITSKGLLYTGLGPIEESEDESNMEELDKPTDFEGLPVQINWNADLPANIVVPKVDVHSLILDFGAVSFLDISGLKGVKTTLKEFIRVDIDVYIVACDSNILDKLHECQFFDHEIKTSIFFLTIHDAMLHILEKHPNKGHEIKPGMVRLTIPLLCTL